MVHTRTSVKVLEIQKKTQLKKDIHAKALSMKQLNAQVAEALLDRIIAKKASGKVSVEKLVKIKAEVMEEEVKPMVAKMNGDVDEMMEGVEEETTTTRQLQGTLRRITALYEHVEKNHIE